MTLPQLRPAAGALSKLSATSSRRAIAAQCRWASHDSHGHHGDAHESYPAETFFTPFYRNVLIISTGLFLAYRLWPAATEEQPWLTRFMSANLNPSNSESYTSSIAEHVNYAKIAADNRRDNMEAQRPKIHRFRYRGMWDQANPNMLRVGDQADMSDLVVKTSADFAKAPKESEQK